LAQVFSRDTGASTRTRADPIVHSLPPLGAPAASSSLGMAVRRSVVDQKYVFEYEVGLWTFGTIQVRKDNETGDLKLVRTVQKPHIRNPSMVMPSLQRLKELKHTHISGVTDALEDSQNFYIVSDQTQGGDLQDWLERLADGYHLQEQTVATYLRQLLQALTYCHSKCIYHRDLRPSSVCLTSKMPDATVKVSDIGLAAILDPDNAITQRNPNPYTAPEVLSGADPVVSGAPDMWSVGALAQKMLVGRAPQDDDDGHPAWLNRIRGKEDKLWADRSEVARDFVQRLLRPANERSTSAKALAHPWLRTVMPIGTQIKSGKEKARDVRHKSLCYMLAVLLTPNMVPHRDFEQLRLAFLQKDTDGDGFVPLGVAQRVILARCAYNEAIAAALDIVDVNQSEVIDLCAATCADLIAREFFASGPTGQPLAGPFRANDLAPRMLKRFFEVYGDRRQPMVTTAAVRAKLRTATANNMESHAGVVYEDILSAFPEDRVIDSQLLSQQLSSQGGHGTPLGGSDLSPMRGNEGPWGCGPLAAAADGGTLSMDNLTNFFNTCGISGKRDESPHSMRIF